MGVKKELRKIERNIGKEIDKTEKTIGKDIKHAEKWVYQRRKFFIKLSYVVGFVALLLIISHFYLRVKGAGI